MKHSLAICAIVKNEHDYLLEWIAYHRVVGVDHFLIYNNSGDDDDGTTELLNKLHEIGAVEVVPWPDRSSWCLSSGVYVRPQLPAYHDGIQRLRNEVEWVAFIDVDEFLLPMKQDDLPSTLKFYERFGGVGVNWKVFGSSGAQKKENIPVCVRFTMASLPEDLVNQHVKGIARPELIRDVSVHRQFLKSGVFVDEHGRELRHPYGFRYPVSYDILRINHYYTKSREEWAAKVARGRASHPEKRSENHFSDARFNDERDTFILKFCDATAGVMRELAASAGIRDYPCLVGPPPIDNKHGSGKFIGGKRPPGTLRRSARNSRTAKVSSEDVRWPGPVLDVHLLGGFANQMMQYALGRRIAAAVEGCRVSNAVLATWGIDHPLLPGPLGPEIIPPQTRHQVDVAQIVDRLSQSQKSRGTFQPNVLWFSNLPGLDVCRGLFPADEHDYPGFGPEYLVCNVRGGEILQGRQMNRVLLPVEFYAEIARTTGLKLVFMGQVEENAYCRALKRRFPDAIFNLSRDAISNFQTFRNSKNLVVAVSTFSWLSAWLSRADMIVLPVNGLFHPVQEPSIDLLPVGDERYRFYLFPINYAVPVDRLAEGHRALEGAWRLVDAELIRKLRTPHQPKRLESFVSMFEESFYLQTYGDIAAAVKSGTLGSGLDHYVTQGFREGRNAFAFDQVWYSTAYPKAAMEVGQGEFVDLRHHYVEVGAMRGYKPLPNQSK